MAGMVPVLLMVSGGSDSMAMLELAAMLAEDKLPVGDATVAASALLKQMEEALPAGCQLRLKCLHINHMLRGQQADEDERFVQEAAQRLGIPCEARRIDVPALTLPGGPGFEAVARQQRYQAAEEVLDAWCAELGAEPENGLVLTAHTLDDRIETYLMRTLVGTGPGGLGSIPRRRGRILRPLLDAGRQELRDFLRAVHPGQPDSCLWHDDPTNEDGSNFRSRVRVDVLPALRAAHPGFERNLARTMDLIAEEDAMLTDQAQSVVYRNLQWDGQRAQISAEVIANLPLPVARRVLRQCLLVVSPESRLVSRQIDRVVKGLQLPSFSAEVDGGVRAVLADGILTLFVAQPPL